MGNTIDKLVSKTNNNALFNSITLGEVISTNDPQQMGRLQVFVPALDSEPDGSLPWAFYGAPFGGINEDAHRGRDDNLTNGPVAYGMWAIPKVGATVLIMCIDNNPDIRVWLGSVHGIFFPHTLPHGRYAELDGPLSSTEQPIQPLYDSQTDMFTSDINDVSARDSFEYKSRGLDRQVAAVDASDIGDRVDYSEVADDADLELPEADGRTYTSTQGYGTDTNDEHPDSKIYSFTTPGMHSWSMDDNPLSCRIKFRTTSGHQIILDDTNERIYINTSLGKTYIELDEKGTIDVYSEQDLSLRSQQDINIVADKTVRIAGKEGIHLVTKEELRLHAGTDIHVKADTDIRMQSDNDTFIHAAADMHVLATNNLRVKGSTAYFEGTNTTHIYGSVVQVGATLNISGPVGVTGAITAVGRISSQTDVSTTTHSLNLHTHTYVLPKIPEVPALQPGITLPQLLTSGYASTATASPEASESEPSESFSSFFPSRVPQHEPYARVYLDIAQTDIDDGTLLVFDAITTDPDSVSEYSYSDENVGRISESRDKDFNRNDKWHR